MDSVKTAPPKASAGFWSQAASVLAFASGAVALIYFVNGLTVPAATAQVRLGTGEVSEPEFAMAWLSGSTTTATFHYDQVMHVSDRLNTRLHLVAIWATVALACWALSRVARALHQGHTNARRDLRRGLGLLALAAACAAFLVPFAQWAQASAVLSLAGSPQGLSPVAEVHVAWVFAGLVILLARELTVGRWSERS